MLIEYSDNSPFSHAGKDLFGGGGLFCVWGGQTRGSFDCQCVDATPVGIHDTCGYSRHLWVFDICGYSTSMGVPGFHLAA
jgi:hypothetical protein